MICSGQRGDRNEEITVPLRKFTKTDIDSSGFNKQKCVLSRMENVAVKTPVLGILVPIALTLGTIAGGVFAQGNTPVGLWETIDDESNEPESYVRIWVDNGELFGKVEKLIRKPGEPSDPKCTKCAGDKKDQPILGMTILSGLRQEGEVWTGGHILDPDNGKVYKCRIKVEEGGRKLEVRGYIGFSLIGRSQTWHRVP
jgi:uncharacterized protein (DUF2147 family)